MELTAAFEAVKANPGLLEIVSDSTYVVNCFRDGWWKGWLKRGWKNSAGKPVANRDIWEPFIEAVRVPLRAILSAPPFIYHVGSPGELDGFGLATRLSYFLWRSMPDTELFDAAREGRLSESAELARQVDCPQRALTVIALDIDEDAAIRIG